MKAQVIKKLLQIHPPLHQSAQAFAPVNIALIKYWGKRNIPLNLPTNDSLSIALNNLGTRTHIQVASEDQAWLNNKLLAAENPFAQRLWQFVDLLRPKDIKLHIHTSNDVPTAAGLASSASGFAALVLALNDLFGWQLDKQQLSILARLGSGSACRSLWPGFVHWHQGQRADGLDSFAEPLPYAWPELRIGLVKVSNQAKAISSTQGMIHTLKTSPLYAQWPQTAQRDLAQLLSALERKDFNLLGTIAQSNALAMHATMLAARPPVAYWQAESMAQIQKTLELQQQGVEIYFTMDAGPNLKLIFEQTHQATLLENFPEAKIIHPFG